MSQAQNAVPGIGTRRAQAKMGIQNLLLKTDQLISRKRVFLKTFVSVLRIFLYALRRNCHVFPVIWFKHSSLRNIKKAFLIN